MDVLARITRLRRARIEQSTSAIVEADCGLAAMTEEEAALVFQALSGVREDAGDLGTAESPRDPKEPLDDNDRCSEP